MYREVNLDDPVEYQKAKWYMTKIIPKITGYAGYSDTDHCYIVLSEARWPVDPDKLLMHPYTEPFGVVLIENHFKRWIAQREMFRDKPELAGKMPKRTKENKTLDIFQSEYSTQDGGQKKFGGWGKTGLGRFNALVTKYVQAKYIDPENPGEIKKSWRDWEMNFMKKLREEEGITAKTLAEQKLLSKGKQQGQVVEALPVLVGKGWKL